MDEESDNDLMSFLEDDNEELPHNGDLLVVKRVLSMQEKGKDEAQRENIFYTRCLVQGKVYSMIIGEGSCTNVAREVKVDEKVLVSFAIGKYKDELLCDMIPMEAMHILLGYPWQFDRKDFQDVFPNEVPSGLPPIRGIKHHIDLIPMVSLGKLTTLERNPIFKILTMSTISHQPNYLQQSPNIHPLLIEDLSDRCLEFGKEYILD
ncbi:hypothetical protein CR513_02334, partial [Mucuna pruriens]